MKRLLLASTALLAAALCASPAAAQLKLGIGGHFSGYVVYADDDAAPDNKDFGIRRDLEIYFTGETTLDNGLTVGVHVEQNIEGGNINNESYVYFSGGWGRVNFGNEDGAAYLLQVAAPSADSNVDGLRTTIQGFSFGGAANSLDYDHTFFGNANDSIVPTDRITYLTPKFNGFQAGVSYAPTIGNQSGIGAIGVAPNLEDLWEVAARWDGQFEAVGISLGAGYSVVEPPANPDIETWNVGTHLSWREFSLGGAYVQTENLGAGTEIRTWVVGAAWDSGPWHAGTSYLARTDEDAAGVEFDSWKAAIGGGYAFGPGMTFRAAVAFGEALDIGGNEADFTQVTLGTDIRF